MNNSAEKLRKSGNPNVMVCERGTQFGYTDLVVDPRNIVRLRDANCPVVADVTHALQQPAARAIGGGGVASGKCDSWSGIRLDVLLRTNLYNTRLPLIYDDLVRVFFWRRRFFWGGIRWITRSHSCSRPNLRCCGIRWYFHGSS